MTHAGGGGRLCVVLLELEYVQSVVACKFNELLP